MIPRFTAEARKDLVISPITSDILSIPMVFLGCHYRCAQGSQQEKYHKDNSYSSRSIGYPIPNNRKHLFHLRKRSSKHGPFPKCQDVLTTSIRRIWKGSYSAPWSRCAGIRFNMIGINTYLMIAMRKNAQLHASFKEKSTVMSVQDNVPGLSHVL